jgi:hypothetical protein
MPTGFDLGQAASNLLDMAADLTRQYTQSVSTPASVPASAPAPAANTAGNGVPAWLTSKGVWLVAVGAAVWYLTSRH